MIKFIFLFSFLLYNNLLASPILIGNDFNETTTINNQSVYLDLNKTMSVNDILEDKAKDLNISSAKSNHQVYFVKFAIKNVSKSQIILIIENERAGTDIIDIDIFDKNNLVQNYQLGDMRGQKLKPFLSTKSIFPLVIEPDQEYTIVAKMQNLGALDLYFNIKSLKNFSYSNNINITICGMFGGAILALMFYNLTIYFSLREKYILLYTLYAASLFMYLYSISGMLYFLNLGINLMALTIATWIFPLLALTFLVIFVSLFFNIKIISKKLNNFLNTLNIINMIFLSLFIYGIFDERVYRITPMYGIFAIIMIMALIFTSIWAYRLKLNGALYFLIAKMGYAIFVIIFTLSTVGFIGYIDYMQYISSFMLVLDAVLIFIAVSTRILVIKNGYEQSELLLIEEAKFSAIGKGLGNVSHQLKTPLAAIASNVAYLKALKTLDNKKLIDEFDETIQDVTQNIEYMKSTISEIQSFYLAGTNFKNINIKKEIDLALKINSDNILIQNTTISIFCDNSITIFGIQNTIANILSILIENSLYIFKEKNIDDSKISIDVHKSHSSTFIEFRDNAGGLPNDELCQIFMLGYTTKSTNGSGLGLAFAKKIIEDKLGGIISVKNIDDGLCFEIVFKNK